MKQTRCEKDGKIFGVGLEKTGTKSLSVALGLLGFNIPHGCMGHSGSIWYTFSRGDYKSGLRSRDGRVGMVMADYFAQIDEAWPGSRFILTTRETDSHLKSLRRHLAGAGLNNYEYPVELFGRGLSWGCDGFVEDRVRWRIRTHQDEVRRHFKDRPEDLLELPLSAEHKWEKLCAFLDKDHPGVPYPHEHKGSYR